MFIFKTILPLLRSFPPHHSHSGVKLGRLFPLYYLKLVNRNTLGFLLTKTFLE